MKKSMILFAVCCLTTAATAGNKELLSDMNNNVTTTSYVSGTFLEEGWKANWFISARFGASAFVGSPVGHGDLFDRLQPTLQLSIGKWVKPTIGLRLTFQGFEMKGSNMEKASYQNIHGDLMYNLSYLLAKTSERMLKWNVSPFIGLGLVHNNTTKQKPFAMTAGVNIGYRFNERLMVTAELGNTLTWKDFDGDGSSEKLGDNIMAATVGLNYTLGRAGWKRVLDAKPYIIENDYLNVRVNDLSNINDCLSKQHIIDQEALAEMKKILEIEGIMDKYNITTDSECNIKRYPKNNYSGLNALRQRLRNKNLAGGDKDEFLPAYWNANDTLMLTTNEYLQRIENGNMFVGAPIFFFFHKGTTNITEKSQILNIREIANVMKKYSLRARIIGAADSQTGTEQINNRLSEQRSLTIKKQLMKQGIADNDITTESRGGIDEYTPDVANRNACVLLYVK